jgi:membrane-bound lytic murein transglycosylase B
VHNPEVTTLAAVSSSNGDNAGAAVVALNKPPADFRFAASKVSSPPPAVVVNSPGAMRIPAVALAAYRNAEQKMAVAAPGCGLSWNLLAGIGRIESLHANGGSTDARGTANPPIYGPALDGTLPGNEVIVQSSSAGRAVYARALGPMQFLPGTWSRYATDTDGDGKADPQNIFDASLAAARYLCSGGLNLRNQSQVLTAILRYNNSMAYAQNVLGWAAAYATGVTPVNLPPITGPIPAIGDAHLENFQGLGPGGPLSANVLPGTDPLALLNLGIPGSAQLATNVRGPLPGPAALLPGAAPCEVICLGSQAPLPQAPLPMTGVDPAMPPAAPWMPQLPPAPWMNPLPADAVLPDSPAIAPADAAPLPGVLPAPAPAAPAPGPALPGPPPGPAPEGEVPLVPTVHGALPGPTS